MKNDFIITIEIMDTDKQYVEGVERSIILDYLKSAFKTDKVYLRVGREI